MKMRILSLNFKENQKYKDNFGMWKTIPASSEMMFFVLGEMNHFGVDVLVGIDTSGMGANTINTVKTYISKLEDSNLIERIAWFERGFPEVKIYRIATSVINGLNGKRLSESETNITVMGSFDLAWSN